MASLLSGRHILVIEDEMLILMMIESMLADLGCDSVTPAATVKQANDLISRMEFDAAMLDLNLDGHASYAVADSLAQRGVPFIFSTGSSLQDIKPEYRNRPVLKKPFSEDDLAAIFNSLFPR